MRVTFAENAM